MSDPDTDFAELRNRYFRSAAIGAIIAFVVFAALMQSGRSGLFGRDLLGNFYDAQARALRAGHLDVPADVPGFEGFFINGRTQIYQGLTPALFRLPLLALSLDGRLSGVSMMTAQAILLFYLCLAGWRARLKVRGSAALGRLESASTAIVTFGLGVGLVAFLASRAWVYHEAAIWGVALSLGSIVHLTIWSDSSSDAFSREQTSERAMGHARRPLVHITLATVLAGLAFNSRSSIGVGPLAALALTCAVVLVRWLTARRGASPERGRAMPADTVRALAVMIVGSLVFVVGYAIVNHARFGSLFGVPLDKQELVKKDRLRLKALAANNGSLFGLRYAPSVALQTIRPDAFSFRPVFPYVGFPTERPAVVGSALFAERDWSTSIPASIPLGAVFAALGIIAVFAPRRWARGTGSNKADDDEDEDDVSLTSWRIPILGAFLGGAPVLVFGYIAQRYMTDFYPFVVLSAVIGFQWCALRLFDNNESASGRFRPAMTRLFISVVAVLALFGAWITLSVALQYQREIAPGLLATNRHGWLALQMTLPGHVSSLKVATAERVPKGERVGDIMVVDGCRALYRWSGRTWFMLESSGGDSAEPGPARPIGLRVQITVGGSVPGPVRILEGTVGDRPVELSVVPMSGQLGLATTYGPSQSWPVNWHERPEGYHLDLEVTENPRKGELNVNPRGSLVEMLTAYSSEPATQWSVPADVPSGVRIKVTPLDTPLCRDLQPG